MTILTGSWLADHPNRHACQFLQYKHDLLQAQFQVLVGQEWLGLNGRLHGGPHKNFYAMLLLRTGEVGVWGTAKIEVLAEDMIQAEITKGGPLDPGPPAVKFIADRIPNTPLLIPKPPSAWALLKRKFNG